MVPSSRIWHIHASEARTGDVFNIIDAREDTEARPYTPSGEVSVQELQAQWKET